MWEPPDQRYEEAIRDFVAWLSQIEVLDVPDSDAELQAFEEAVRSLAPQLLSPPGSPPDPGLVFGSPPASLVIPRSAVDLYLRRAFLIWTTELKPLWLNLGQDCAGTQPDEQCVLLG